MWDPHNASFYFAWIIAGVLAGLLAWICFTLYENDNPEILINILLNLYDIPVGSDEAKNIIDSYGEHLYYLPFYGLNISFFLTLFLSFMAGHRRWFLKRSLLLITKAVVAGIAIPVVPHRKHRVDRPDDREQFPLYRLDPMDAAPWLLPRLYHIFSRPTSNLEEGH